MAQFEQLEGNLRLTLRTLAGAREDGESAELPGIAVACPAVDFAMFNAVTLTSRVATLADLESRIRAASGYFRARGLPWSVWVCDGWLSARVRRKSRGAFRRHGLRVAVELPGMAAERLRPPSRTLPKLECRRVGDAETRYAFNYIMAASYGIPIPVCTEVYQSERLWRGSLVGHLGYFDGNPVTAAATLASDGVVGVYAVATLPAHQGCGYAESILRHALERARLESGIERSVLESSRAGFGLYERMGYKTVTYYTVYASS